MFCCGVGCVPRVKMVKMVKIVKMAWAADIFFFTPLVSRRNVGFFANIPPELNSAFKSLRLRGVVK